MRDHRPRWRGLAIGLLALILLAAMFATAHPREERTAAERFVRDVLAPVETGLSVATQYVRDVAGGWRTIRSLQAENEALRQELAVLQVRNQMLEEAWRENQALRATLGLLEESERRLLPAVVVGRPVSHWWSQVTVNRGRRHGVVPRLPVVASEGAVGWVLSVTDRTAEVLLLVDPKSAVGGVIRRTSDPVVVEGVLNGPTPMRLRALVADADLRPGDLVVTSEFSQVFPGGFPVGRIAEVIPGAPGRALEAWVEPVVDMARLEVVAILLNGEGAGDGLSRSVPAGDGDLDESAAPAPGRDEDVDPGAARAPGGDEG